MGPGIITGFAGNDAGGVTTYTAVGARYGFEMMWLLLLSTAGLLVIQEMCARMGAVTGKGLSDLIRERFGVRWTIVAMLALLIANGSNIVAEYAGIAASLELFRVQRIVSVPITAVLIWVLAVFFIVVVAGAVLHPAGIHVDSAADAAQALGPLAGQQAQLLFGVGLFGASLLAATIMPLSTSYAICEAFGWESGISKNFREAPVFMGLFTLLVVVGALIVLSPSVPLIPVILVSQNVNGLLLPIVLVFILKLAGDRRIMGDHANGRVSQWIGIGTAVGASVLSIALVAITIVGAAP